MGPFREALRKVRELVESLRKSGQRITTIDVGGGLGVPYERNANPPSPAEYGAVVRETLSDMGCTLVFEPGRLLVGNAGILVTKVIYMKPTDTRTFAIVDVAMNDLLRPSLYGAYHDIIPVAEPAAESQEKPIDIVGPVCETGDTFAEQTHVRLLIDLHLARDQAGAQFAILAAAVVASVAQVCTGEP